MRRERNKGNICPNLQGSPVKVSVHQKCQWSGETSVYSEQELGNTQMPEYERSIASACHSQVFACWILGPVHSQIWINLTFWGQQTACSQGIMGKCLMPRWLGKTPNYQESGRSCLSRWLLGSVSVIKPGGSDRERTVSEANAFSGRGPSLPISQVSNYSSLVQKAGERHKPLASMGQGCPQLHNSIYSFHLFDAPGSEIQGEDNQSNLTSDQVLTATQ